MNRGIVGRASGAKLLVLVALACAARASGAPLVYVFGQADFPASNGDRLAAGGDFNADGRPDLIAINYANNSVSILLGQPDGSFVPVDPSYAVGQQPVAAAVGDFDGDGNLDLAVVNQGCPMSDPCPPGSVSILLGNGDGTLRPRVDFEVGPNPVAIVVADFNGDQIPDLAVAAAVSRIDSGRPGLVSILLGNGDGTFGPREDFAAGAGVIGLVAGDFSTEGVVDLVVDNHPSVSSRTVSFLQGMGDGTFTAPASLDVNGDPLALAAGDFNEDGKPDLAVATGTHIISVLLGNGGGTFQPPVGYPAGFGPQRLITTDIDGDGHLDLVVSLATNLVTNGAVSVLLGNGNGTFRPRFEYLIGTFGNLVAGDFNGDAKVDVAVANGANTVSVVLGNGDGTLAHPDQLPTQNQPSAVLTADFNGDGKLDLAVANANTNGTVSIFLGNGDGTFAAGLDSAVGNTPSALVVADFDGDGILDLAATNLEEATVSILLGLGDGTFLPRVNLATGLVPRGVVAGDFNGDGYVDLAVTSSRDNNVGILLGHGDGTFEPFVPYAAGRGAAGIVAADFNGDGKVDLAVANSQTGGLREQGIVSVLLGNGDGTFQAPRNSTTENLSPMDLVVGVFNRDGRLDLAVTTNRDPYGSISILLGNGDGTFRMSANYQTGRFARQLIAGDFDGDGITDLAQAQLGSNLMILLKGRADGTFRVHARYGAGVGPVALTAGDFNGDLTLDVAVVNLGSNNASIFLSDPTIPVGAVDR